MMAGPRRPENGMNSVLLAAIMRRSTVVARVSSCRFHRSFLLQALADPAARRIGWRGRVYQRVQLLEHRWQRDWSTQPQERTHKREVWRRLRIGGVSAAVRRLAGAVRLSALVSADSDAVGGHHGAGLRIPVAAERLVAGRSARAGRSWRSNRSKCSTRRPPGARPRAG